jgi:hypothetical protein
MKIKFDYPVLTTARLGRSTKERTVVVLDSDEFVVPEISANEVEQTVSWKDFGNPRRVIQINGTWFQKLNSSYNLNLGHHIPYYFDFQGMSSRGPRQIKPQGALEHLIGKKILKILRENKGTVASVLATDELINTVAGDVAAADLKKRDNEIFSKVDDEPFEDAKEQMREAAEKLLTINGEFWQRCQTPMLWSGLGTFNSVRHEVYAHTYFENVENFVSSHWIKPALVSSISGLDENDEFFTSFLGLNGKEAEQNIRDINSLELNFENSEEIKIDGPSYTLMHLAHLAISEAGEALTKRVMPVHKLNIMSFVFRENLSAFGPDRLLELQRTFSALHNAYVLGEATEDLIQCVRRIPNDVLIQMDEQTVEGYSKAIVDEAVSRWEDRPVHMDKAIYGNEAKPRL